MAGRRILLTGASGLLGGELAGRLVDAGHAVTGLVNRNGAMVRNDGRVLAAAAWDGAVADPGLRVMTGDVTAPGLGWSASTWTTIAESHDLLLHAAALTRFDAQETEYRAVNVDGTGRMIELARAGGMGMLHVSTAYVCGERDGTILEQQLDCGQRFANGYEASKAASERAVRASRLRTVIVRPSIVVGDHKDGRIRRFDTFYVLLKLLGEGRLSTMPAKPGATLDLVPIDHVADTIEVLVERFDRAVGATLHVVADRPTPVEAFPRTLARHPGLAAPRFVDPVSFDPAVLTPSERRFYDRGASVYAGYFARDPRFDDTQARALSGLTPKPVDQDWWDRLVDYAIASGFVRASEGAVAPGLGAQASRSRPNGIASDGSTAVSDGSR